ncbi:hypothetical protein SZN_13746 [Streptomyces zinciresistens K42]|uniref:Secreted protein n=2 Tax=Streptomyces TaxID=1883 RepID=G2GB42_9ACTN|nr:hypothetical protein SZN_13746 [Streptomyces zinciresistens K42]
MFAAGLATLVSAAALSVGGMAVPAAAAGGVDCSGRVHGVDPNVGIVGCTNNTGGEIRFRADIVCGLAPDVSGDWVTLRPGAYGESVGSCAWFSSGVGSVGWTIA